MDKAVRYFGSIGLKISERGDCCIYFEDENQSGYVHACTQKEEIVPKAVEIAKQKVKIFRISAFLVLINEIRKKIEYWENLPPSERTSFIDNVVSPYELEELLKPSDQPLVQGDESKRILSQ